MGEKLRDDQEDYQEALSRRGRYQKVKDNLEVKEVVVRKGERRRRFVLVYNPEEAKKDRATRKLALQKIKEALLALGDQRGKAHKKAVCPLLAHRTLGWYLRQLKNGAIKIARKKIKAEAHLDGKYLLSTSDDSLSPEDVALGYNLNLAPKRAHRLPAPNWIFKNFPAHPTKFTSSQIG